MSPGMAASLVLESGRIEPRLSMTSTVIETASTSELRAAVAELDDHVATLLLRRADAELPPANVWRQVFATWLVRHSVEVASEVLNVPVVELPERHDDWADVVVNYTAFPSRAPVVMFISAKNLRAPAAGRARLLDKLDLVVSRWGKVGKLASPDAERAEPGPVVPPSLEAAVELRDELLRTERWLSSTELGERARGGEELESNPHQYASRLRRERRLLGVRLKGQYLHPAFQLDFNGAPHPKMAELLRYLPDEDHGWAAAFWCFAPTHKLLGARPADMFRERPNDVIEAARKDFRGDDADW